jgi:hypothetical protein
MIGDAIKRTKERPGQGQEAARRPSAAARAPRTFTISLVGYTNAGKSTLFNALVKARAYAADQLFATLDTTTRQLYLGDAGGARRRPSVSLSDTVGFIRDLPHGLIDAFQRRCRKRPMPTCCCTWWTRANPHHLEQIEQVQRVLHEIGAAEVPQMLVFNKIDALEKDSFPLHMKDRSSSRARLQVPAALNVFVSSRTGEGLPLLRASWPLCGQPAAEEIPQPRTLPDIASIRHNVGVMKKSEFDPMNEPSVLQTLTTLPGREATRPGHVQPERSALGPGRRQAVVRRAKPEAPARTSNRPSRPQGPQPGPARPRRALARLQPQARRPFRRPRTTPIAAAAAAMAAATAASSPT